MRRGQHLVREEGGVMHYLVPLLMVCLYALLGAALAVFVVVWCKVMWVAFTEGDDAVARFGRRVLRREP